MFRSHGTRLTVRKFKRLKRGQIFDLYGRKFERQGVNTQPSPQAYSAWSMLDSTMSCDVTERARSLFPRLRTKNRSRKNASGQIFVRQRRGCMDACLRSCKKERNIVSVLSLALLDTLGTVA